MKIKAVAVQMEFRLNDFLSSRNFRERIFDIMKRIDKMVELNERSLVVFPEDVGSFLVFLDEDVSSFDGLERVAKAIIKKNFFTLLLKRIRYNVGWITSFILSKYRKIWDSYYGTFSDVAKEYGCYIVGGSLLIPRIEVQKGKVNRISNRIYNTSYLFGTKGEIVGVQRKVHLIELEEKLEISSASLSELRVYKTSIGRIGIAICYDAFFKDVVEKLVLQETDILVQPSANPELWDERLEKEWPTGCWQAVQKYPTLKYGINPMGVGKIFDLVFEGMSSIIAKRDKTKDKSGYLAKSTSRNKEEIIYADILL